MPSIDIPTLVEDVVTSAFIDQTGELPQGNFKPDDKTISSLKTAFGSNLHEMREFLRLSVYAHISRTSITRSPFFINTILFAKSSLEFLQKHEAWLKEHYSNVNTSSTFKNNIYKQVSELEDEFINVHLLWADSEVITDFPTNIWWAIFSADMGRFDKPTAISTLPDHMVDEFHDEIRLMKEDERRYFSARRAAIQAIRDVRIKTARRWKLINPIYSNFSVSIGYGSLMGMADMIPKAPLRENDWLFRSRLILLSDFSVRPINIEGEYSVNLGLLDIIQKEEDT
jgi:hypothetical protein